MATMSEADGGGRRADRRSTVRADPGSASTTPPVDRADGFEALYAEEYEPMLRIAFLLVDSTDLAEEVVHDAFAKVYERWHQADQPRRLPAHLRGEPVPRPPASSPDRAPDAAAAGRRRPTELGADELADALATLPIKRRAAIVLRYYDGLSEARIAEVLGVKPGTVKSLLSRGLAELREVIEP